MDANKALISNIFNGFTVVEVPFFQRSYVWKEDLWARFLEDMEFIVKTRKPHFRKEKLHSREINLLSVGQLSMVSSVSPLI